MRYIGSVKFFKHLIYSGIGLGVIAVLTACVIMVSSFYNKYSATNGVVQAKTYSEEATSSNEKDTDKDTDTESSMASESETSDVTTPFEYQTLYPEMYASKYSISKTDEKTAYLTFDDGPSKNTEKILDILKKNNIKATFFIVTNYIDKGDSALLKRIVDEGHTLGIHSDSHDYKKIYSSVDAFLDDFNKAYTKIYNICGVKPSVFRFPGGSINSYNTGIYQDIIAEMTRRNFRFFDWNVSAQDAALNVTKQTVISSITDNLNRFKPQQAVVLLHDSEDKKPTLSALPEVIELVKSKGYKFDVLRPDVAPVSFNYSY